MYGFMSSIMARQRYAEYIESEKAKHTRAVDVGKSECTRCGYCCLQRPCIPTPDELEKIIEFLGLTAFDAIKKFFLIDSLGTDETKFIFPAKETQLDITGKYIPSERTFDEGYCIFYDKREHNCKIWPVRPKTARVMECWTENDDITDKTLEETLKAWENFDFSKFGIEDNALADDDYDNDELT